MKNLAIIMSGGTGSRIGERTPKQFLKIGDKTILELSMIPFQNHPDIDSIIVVSRKGSIEETDGIVTRGNFTKVISIISGGDTRQKSSEAGVNASSDEYENILIHDSARPFVSSALISRVIERLKDSDAVTPVIDSSDTLIKVIDNMRVEKYLDRNSIKRVQTPQGFRRDIILKAHILSAGKSKGEFTDDCSMIMYHGLSGISVVEGDVSNKKITVPDDLR